MPRSALTLTLLLSACAGAANGEPRSEGNAPSEPPAAGDPASSESPVEGALAAEPASPPRACPADEGDIEQLCDASGAVVGRLGPVDMLHPPPTAEVIYQSAERGVQRSSLTLLLEGERLHIRAVRCAACRRVLGDAFEGQLDRLDSAQRMTVQQRFAIPGPERVDARAWRDYASSAAGRVELDALVQPGP